MPKRSLTAIGLALAPILLALALSTAAQATVPPSTTASSSKGGTGVTVTQPQNGDTIASTGLQIVGTAPPAWLVSVSIVDSDLDRTGIQHQPHGRVDGSVTSDSTGRWAFVPQVKMVPGSFEVSASYISTNNEAVDSPIVRFVVVNESGESSVPSTSLKLKIAVPLAVVLVGIGFFVWRRFRRHRAPSNRPSAAERPTRRDVHETHRRRDEHESHLHLHEHKTHRHHDEREAPWDHDEHETPTEAQYDESGPLFMNTIEGRAYQAKQARKMQDMHAEMTAIQSALAETAESLERSNRAIGVLHRQIHDELAANTQESDHDPVVAPAKGPPVKRRATPKKGGPTKATDKTKPSAAPIASPATVEPDIGTNSTSTAEPPTSPE